MATHKCPQNCPSPKFLSGLSPSYDLVSAEAPLQRMTLTPIFGKRTSRHGGPDEKPAMSTLQKMVIRDRAM